MKLNKYSVGEILEHMRYLASYTGTTEGIFYLNADNKLVFMESSEILKGHKLVSLLPYNDNLFVTSARAGLYLLNEESIQKIHSVADDFIYKNQLFRQPPWYRSLLAWLLYILAASILILVLYRKTIRNRAIIEYIGTWRGSKQVQAQKKNESGQGCKPIGVFAYPQINFLYNLTQNSSATTVYQSLNSLFIYKKRIKSYILSKTC